MADYLIKAQLTKWFEIGVVADSESDAIDKVSDWIDDDFDEFNVNAQWDFEAMEM